MDFLQLAHKYGEDDYRLLKENPSLKNMYMFSDWTGGCLDLAGGKPGDRYLILGATVGLVQWLLKRQAQVVVFEPDPEQNTFLFELFKNYPVKLAGDLERLKAESFDFLALFGAEYFSRLPACMEKLHPLGKLVLAFDNPLGVNYICGAPGDRVKMSLSQVKKLLETVGVDAYQVYYPFPDYRLAEVVFSDACLPRKGELHQIHAHDYPPFAPVDPDVLLETALLEGEFPAHTNSYVIISGRSQRIYAKYNRTRRPCYQIKTEILQDRDQKYVLKTPLRKEGAAHIQGLLAAPGLLSQAAPEVNYVKAKEMDGGACFEYIQGESLRVHLHNRIGKGECSVFTEEVRRCLKQILGPDPVNIDGIFDNFLVNKGGIYAIDYEWTDCRALLPGGTDRKTFIYCRVLAHFYQGARASLESAYGIDSLEKFLALFGFDQKALAYYQETEEFFQKAVHGDYQEVYLDNYFVDILRGPQIDSMRKEYRILKERSKVLIQSVKEKDMAIRKMHQIKVLTDNHVHNLEIMIEDLHRENGEMAKTLVYLNRHEALIFKVRRRIGRFFQRLFPKDSIRQKKLAYGIFMVTHPIRYFKQVTSEEGKNLIEGDFKIGSIYKEQGRLNFLQEEAPAVSIVIPVYNQIHYTYACLLSILKQTKGVTYEVIVADDVSTDATRELEKFVQGIVISRNTVNQGFLKNCNQAAAKARGKYILFLNNDTTVGENWLAPLVSRLEQDPAVGMVGSKLIYPDGRLQEAGGIIWQDGSGWNYGRLDDPHKHEYNYARDVDYISGASIMLSRSLWQEIGGFDERFAPAYCEDSDLAFEVRKRGLRVVYEPKSVVTHYEGVSNGTDVNGTGLKRYQVENSIKLREKWKEELQKQYPNEGEKHLFRARERSRGKKIVLFVDHYVPTYDKDAGSKTTFQYIKLLLSQGFGVKFLPDNFLDTPPYTGALEELGVEVLYGRSMQGEIWDWIEDHAPDLHLVYLNRPHIATKYVDFIKERTGLKVVYYGHDLHFLRERREYDLTGDVEKKRESEYWKSMELTLMQKVDMSYYPSQIEVDYLHTLDESLAVKAITAYVYEDLKEREYVPDTREGVLFVGGFSHPPNADACIYFLENMWDAIYEKIQAPFYIVGSNGGEDMQALHNPEKGILFKGFVSDEELADLYRQVKLVVVPLRYGAGVKGKVIEALHEGLPVVTTSVGAEGIEGAEQCMKIADTPKDFIRMVSQLYFDGDRLLQLHTRATEYILKRHSPQAVWQGIAEDFQ